MEVAQALGQAVAAALVVRAFEADDHRERMVAVLFHPVDGQVGADVVDPTGGGGFHAVDFERAVLIVTLVEEAGGVVEARALAVLVAHVPLAEVGGLVAGGAHQGGMGDRVFGQGGVVVDDAVGVVVAAGEERGAAGRAEREGDKCVAETHALGGEPVHGRRLEPRVAGAFAMLALHGPHRVPALVIGDDEQEVWFARGGVQRRGGGERGEEPRSGAAG